MFLEHPHYDDSSRQQWLTLEPPRLDDLADDSTEDQWLLAPEGSSPQLVEAVKAQKDALCALALGRVREHVGSGYLAERPHPQLSEFLFHPTSETSFRVYIEYFFSESGSGASAHNDVWWVIVNCPGALPPLPDYLAGEPKYYVIGLGWYVA